MAADPLQLLGSALSSQAGSDQQHDLLGKVRDLLEFQPAAIHPLVGTLVTTIQTASDSMFKFWMLDLILFALSKSPLSVEAKATLAEACLPTLLTLLFNATPRTLKLVIQCFSSVYPLLFRTLCINRGPQAQWEQLTQARSRIVDFLTSADSTVNLGMKEAALKFVLRTIQVHTRGVSDPRLQNKADPNLAMVPGNHPFIQAATLEKDGNELLQTVITVYYQSPNPDLVSALINSWGPFVKHRPSFIAIVATAIEAWTPGPLQAADVLPRDVKSIDKAAKIFLSHLLRTPYGSPYSESILKAVHSVDMRLRAAAVLEDELRSSGRKRAAPVDTLDGPDAKRLKLDTDASSSLHAPAATASSPLVVDFIVANLRLIPDETLAAAVKKFRDEHIASDAPPVEEPPTMKVKVEPVDPLQMEMDDEIEFNSDDVNREVARTTAVAAPSVPDAPVEPQGLPIDALERLAEFVNPQAVKLDQKQKLDLVKTIEGRGYALASEMEDAPLNEPGAVGERKLTRVAELQIILIIRALTRSGVFDDELVLGDEPKKDDPYSEMQVDVARRKDIMRDKLCDYILVDFSSRLRLAQLWMNEEWYNDRLQRERSPDSEQHYDLWLRRLLDGVCITLDDLDARDRTFTRFLLDLPELSNETLAMLRDLCIERPDAVKQMAFLTLRELVTIRAPVRQIALEHVLDLTTHPDKMTRTLAIKTVRPWVPDSQPMSRLVIRFARRLLRRLQTLPRPPKAPTLEESEEDGQLPFEPDEDEAQLRQPTFLPAKLAFPVDRSIILQHMELVFALCVKAAPEFLDEIFAAYELMEPSVQEAVQELIQPLIRGLGPNNGKLLMVLRSFPPRAESLALKVLTFFTTDTRPTPPLVAVVKGLVSERDLDPRFLIPILGEMDKSDIVKHLPRIVSVLNGTLEQRQLIRNVFTQVITAPPSTTGTSNQPRAKQNDLLTPAELVVLLLEHEMEIGIKQTVEAVNLCFSMPDIFGQEVLAVVMQQIVDEPVLPILFLRTVIQAVQTYKSLIGFVSTTLLSRLITKKIWQIQKLWEGFIRCAKLIAPASFGALLQLPREQLRELIEQEPSLKAGLRDFVIKKAGNKARVQHFLEVFGDEPEQQQNSAPPTPPPTSIAAA
ncbi:Symplekin tight junction protein C terminal-domain-containing protein [Auriculariales sp. MPI-PUGE-AT-0066]|nr:Symplekin tight junction protein C terminal-domain-containing protein [Auriculariales sp. MPI-PUGE-AT-0066]